MEEKRPANKFNVFALRRFILTLFLVVVAGAGGYIIGTRRITLSARDFPQIEVSREQPESYDDLDFGLFWRVWDTLGSNYFDKSKLSAPDMVYGAIQGMVAAVGDPYTVFLPPKENKLVQEDLTGNFEGVGIRIGYKGTKLAVMAPLPGSPAEAAGVRAGDLIIGITDEAKEVSTGTVGMTLPEAVELIRGKRGTVVTLTLLREDTEEPLEFDLKREEINVPSIVLTYVGEREDIAHLEVIKFVAETQKEWDEAVLDIQKRQNVSRVILDVRNNPGGYMQAAIDLASEFVGKDKVIVIQESGNGSREEYRSAKVARLDDYQVVVLINEGSASASEILAGALRDIEGVKLVGTTSFGKGTIQETMQVNGGSGLHITTSRWLTPNKNWVNEVGLTPDHEIEDNPDTENDEALDEAIRIISG